ncbi:hypothetical protein ASF48_05050 [Rathayibacter sp. Leaf299]|uniref:hypothetical protein n=1 Tax=Rathayibacter sp. Leaf299 TaxID=1736328 RepID=UPI0006FA42DC|nr:hypothetical protein [Rathayibacter sp. Leaf299]KQQ22554.1 hypothetical protein ASF48_05050 [Rathayibacter sp. Leaf299]
MTTITDRIGEIHEDRDSRMAGRRIRIVAAFEKKDPWGRYYPAFRVEVVNHPAVPTAIGNKSSIGEDQLAKRYRQVAS